MRLLIQRVTRAQVTVDQQIVGSIGPGLLIFIGIRHGDTAADAEKLARKAVNCRLFSDNSGKMNLSLLDTGGEMLVVSQFTLYADASRGNRPSYSLAARPEDARSLYQYFVAKCRELKVNVATGVFQAHMEVDILNDGPVTIVCQTEP